MAFTIGFCGTTNYSVQCAQALATDSRFRLAWVLTPPAKPVGREQTLTNCALAQWAQEQSLPLWTVTTDLAALQPVLGQQPPIDFLVVVAFGYRLPDWMLQLPRLGAINVHPSRLPDYRGASPGQFVILHGENQSAVTVMAMNATFDTGGIIAQLPLTVPPTMTQTAYYDAAFSLVATHLADILDHFARDPRVTPQPEFSTTPYARRLERTDGFLPWEIVAAAHNKSSTISAAARNQLAPVLQNVLNTENLAPAPFLYRAWRAFHPWPGIWTILPTYKQRGQVRCKILEVQINKEQASITAWQIEGEKPRTDLFPW